MNTSTARPENEAVAVIQADRDAAANLCAEMGGMPTACAMIRNGEADAAPTVRIIAAHRLAFAKEQPTPATVPDGDALREWKPHLDYAGEPMREGEFRDPPEGGAFSGNERMDREALAFDHLANVLFADPGFKSDAAFKAAREWWSAQDAQDYAAWKAAPKPPASADREDLRLRSALNKIADLGSCAGGSTPQYRLFQQAIDIATGAL